MPNETYVGELEEGQAPVQSRPAYGPMFCTLAQVALRKLNLGLATFSIRRAFRNPADTNRQSSIYEEMSNNPDETGATGRNFYFPMYLEAALSTSSLALALLRLNTRQAHFSRNHLSSMSFEPQQTANPTA